MSGISAIMKERNREADARLNLMSELIQRRDSDANNCMVELMTTMQDLTLGVRAAVSQTAAAQTRLSPMPVARNLANIPSTSPVPPPIQTTYRKVAQPSEEQVKQPKLTPPATYRKEPTKANKMASNSNACRVTRTDPMTEISSVDPFARGASTTGDYYSAASGLLTQKSDYHTALLEASTNPPMLSFREKLL